jgi:hypothetical protein
MAGEKLVRVRVLPERALSLPEPDGSSRPYVAGDELELPADEAKALAAEGFVEKVK